MSEEERVELERQARRLKRAQRRGAKSLGADVLSFPAAQSIGLARPGSARMHGRGETARRVEAQRRDVGGPRAAVYTQEHVPLGMRIRRMFGLPGRLRLSGFSSATATWVAVLRLILVILLCVALVGFAIAGPAHDYYSAWRKAGALQVEYEALAEQNAELADDLARLQSLEGIEDEARLRGYVFPDEEALVVEGLEEQSTTDPALVEEALAEYEANQPWYVRVLDVVLGYSAE